jgi:hypothetical protein
MTQRPRGSLGGRFAVSAALLTSLTTAAAFMVGAAAGTGALAVPEAAAQTTTPAADCTASPEGTALNRSGWVASTNAPSSSADAPANALDGNLATRFSTNESQRPGLYFEVNMGVPQTFDALEMAAPRSPTDYARSFDVEVSNNGTNWTTVAACTGSGNPEVVSFPVQTAQYVLVALTGTSTYWWSIDEFNVLSTSTGASCYASPSGSALNQSGWVASTNAPSSSADAPANALDGNLSTRFSTNESQRPGLYFEVDMGTPRTFNEVEMAVPNSPTDYARAYQVEVSSNGSNWTTVATCVGTGTTEVVSFPTQSAQYVQVVLTGTSKYWWSIDEFDLSMTPPPPPTSTTTTTTTTTTTVPSTTTSSVPHVRFPCVGPDRFRCCFGWGRYPVGPRCCTGPQHDGIAARCCGFGPHPVGFACCGFGPHPMAFGCCGPSHQHGRFGCCAGMTRFHGMYVCLGGVPGPANRGDGHHGDGDAKGPHNHGKPFSPKPFGHGKQDSRH